MPRCALLTAVNNYNESLEKLQDFFFKTETKTKTKCSWPRPRLHNPRPRPRLSFLSSRRLETKTGLEDYIAAPSLPPERCIICGRPRERSKVKVTRPLLVAVQLTTCREGGGGYRAGCTTGRTSCYCYYCTALTYVPRVSWKSTNYDTFNASSKEQSQTILHGYTTV